MTLVKSNLAKGLSVFLAVALIFTTLPGGMLKASAATTLSINQTVGSGGCTRDSDGNITISGNGNYTISGGSTTARISVASGVAADVTLSGVTIDVSGISNKCAFSVASGASVNLTLSGTNTLKSGDYCAGLQVPQGAALSITGGTTDNLTATGGAQGAGIGSGSRCPGGIITINGGTVTAAGGNYGAGIGGGAFDDGAIAIINGGKVTATGGANGAGIGGGTVGNGGKTIVSGGAVTATGGFNSAGIGGGNTGSGGNISINSGNVNAKGGYFGAGIGGGYSGKGGTATITGGMVTATGHYAADIGGGKNGSAGTTTITGGSVNASSVQSPVTDGNGHTEYCVTTDASAIGTNKTVTGSVCGGHTSDMQTDGNGKLYFWMPATGGATINSGGTWYSTGIVSVSGNTTATLAAMESLDISNGTITIGNGTVTQTGQSPTVNPNGYVIAQSGSASTTNTVSVTSGTHNIVLAGVNIDVHGTADGCALAMSGSSTVNLTLSGANLLKSGQNRAGLEAPQGTSLSVTGGTSDSLIAKSYVFGAGIGGGGSLSGNGGTGGTITINGGKIDANGSTGIGGGESLSGNGGVGGTITINGGEVKAYTNNNKGAGIGGSVGQTGGAGGIITINGGMVNATCNGGSSSIGGGGGSGASGSGGAGGNVTITGGTVNATGSNGGAGIGGGYRGSAGTITITGGSVNASSIQGTPTSGASTPANVYLTTVTVPTGTNVNALSVKQGGLAYSYGYKDMQADTASYGKLYLWLPVNATTTADVTTESGVYTGYHGAVSNTTTISSPAVLKMDQNLTISGVASSYIYNAAGQNIAPTVTGGASDITSGVAYSGTDAATNSTLTDSSTQPVDAGSYTVTATKAGNAAYNNGTKTAGFSIAQKPLTNSMAADITAQTYTGSAIQPGVIVTDGSSALTGGTDYILSYGAANTNAGAGTGSVTVTGKGNYSGSVTKNFSISQKAITLTLTANPQSSSNAGTNVTLTASVSGAVNLPSGSVTFKCDSAVIADKVTIQNNSGNYTAQTTWSSVPGGVHNLSAEYVPAATGENYSCAAAATLTGYSVSKQNQTGFNFTSSSISKTFGDSDFTISAAGGQSAGGVTYVSGDTGIATVDTVTGTVHIKKAGSVTITATKAADANYNQAGATITVTIGQAATSVKTSPTASDISVIGKLSASKLTGGSGIVAGIFAWTNSDTVVTQSGNYGVTFTPSDTTDYKSCTCMVNVTVTPILTNGQSQVSLDLTGVTFPTGVTSISLGSDTQGGDSSAYSVVEKLIGQDKTLGSLSGLTVYDLNLLDQNGNPITNFTSKIKVKVPIPTGMSGDLKVFWYNPADGTLTDMNAGQENGYLTFQTTHFSYYAIAQLTSSTNTGSSSGTVQNPKTGSNDWPLFPLAVLAGGVATGEVIVKRRRFFRIKKSAK